MAIKAGYLGPVGTYSGIAARKLCPSGELVPYSSFPAVMAALKSGEVQAAVLPIENTLNGAVTQNLDILHRTEGVYAKAACAVEIDHRLVTIKGADKNKIKRIYSHAQALAQCAQYLSQNFPKAELLQTSSTAGCLQMIKSEEDAGVISASCVPDGFEISKERISDEEKNYTQFLLVVKGTPPEDAFSDRIFFSVTCLHEAGALVKLLNVLYENGINLTEIESRPIKNRTGEFVFFIEAEGNYADGKIKSALEKLRAVSSSFKFLGCYECGLPK